MYLRIEMIARANSLICSHNYHVIPKDDCLHTINLISCSDGNGNTSTNFTATGKNQTMFNPMKLGLKGLSEYAKGEK